MMDELKINLENCYGIGKLDETISFSDSVAAVIYAPNGEHEDIIDEDHEIFD